MPTTLFAQDVTFEQASRPAARHHQDVLQAGRPEHHPRSRPTPKDKRGQYEDHVCAHLPAADAVRAKDMADVPKGLVNGQEAHRQRSGSIPSP
ncbi:MAG: hypothetical protein M0C28_17765 [Candidatus Moduliflexus flocculans]|nr:hypothetical protein [Candidatus Moduliflexus flocculans]